MFIYAVNTVLSYKSQCANRYTEPGARLQEEIIKNILSKILTLCNTYPVKIILKKNLYKVKLKFLLRAPPHRYCPHPKRPASPRAAVASAQRRRFGLGRFGLARAERRHLASSPSTATPTVQPSGGGRLSAPARSSDKKLQLKILKNLYSAD